MQIEIMTFDCRQRNKMKTKVPFHVTVWKPASLLNIIRKFWIQKNPYSYFRWFFSLRSFSISLHCTIIAIVWHLINQLQLQVFKCQSKFTEYIIENAVQKNNNIQLNQIIFFYIQTNIIEFNQFKVSHRYLIYLLSS